MPVLAQILANAFSGVLSWLTVLLGRKLAVGSALAAFLVAGWVALQLALKAAAELVCRPCRLAYPIRDDIPIMLEDEARKLPPEEEVAG